MRNASLASHKPYSELSECLELWLEALLAQGASPQTVKNYRQGVGAFIEFLHHASLTTLDAVQPHHIRKWLLQRRQAGVKPITLQNDYRNPRAWWNWCLREGLTDNNPFAKVEKPKAPPVHKPALTPEQVHAILNACQGKDWLFQRDRALVLLMLDTGLRLHEAHGLTVQDATQPCLLIRGKGGKQRAVFLSPQTRLALKRYLNACPYTLTPESPLWWGAYGPLTRHGLQEVFHLIGKRAGVTPLGPHAFRRTFATWSLRSGIDLEHLRLLMGHSDYTVLRQYLALVETDLQQAHQQHSPLNHLLKGRK